MAPVQFRLRGNFLYVPSTTEWLTSGKMIFKVILSKNSKYLHAIYTLSN
ncbi:Uncharacterised protein [Salmonella enterica subsp. arizonae]|uniref:Uncharacterized protein n=1 Tax=Salmonella enterica subsp. arizonae TaxID=59203 RepID=A0A447R2V3_SALER|nr:Uncharacterised protein [Salmonella enterica subsp. arizonae]